MPANALTYAPLPPPDAKLMLDAVSETAPVVAITAAGPPAPPINDIELLAASVADVPWSVAPVIAMVAGSMLSAPPAMIFAFTAIAAGEESLKLLP